MRSTGVSCLMDPVRDVAELGDGRPNPSLPSSCVSAGDTPPKIERRRTLTGCTEPVAEVISVRVKPGSSKGPLVETGQDGQLTVFVREQAVGGKANEAVVRVLAEHLGVPRSHVRLTAGATARIKRFRIG